MKTARNILAAVAGYLIFAISSVLFFRLNEIDPHGKAGPGTMAAVIVFGMVAALVAGTITKLIAPGPGRSANLGLGALMAAFALISLLLSSGEHYTQVAAIILFAPIAIVAGYLGRRV
jgi:hypothetical protein